MLRPGWERLRDEAPAAGALAWSLLDDPGPLLGPLSAGPQTFVHGDWKAGQPRQRPGRPHDPARLGGARPGARDRSTSAWYLAVNCDRLPEPKDAVMARYRDGPRGARHQHRDWWDEQMALALIVGFVQLGWNKHGDELAWWADRVVAARRPPGMTPSGAARAARSQAYDRGADAWAERASTPPTGASPRRSLELAPPPGSGPPSPTSPPAAAR